MKILLINAVQSKGSTGNIVTSLFSAYKELGHDTYLMYGRGPKVKEDNVYKPTLELESKIHHFISLFTGNMYGGMHISTRGIISRIKKINPDVIHIHLLNGYYVNAYRLISWLKKQPCKVILTMHADFMMSANCGIAMDCEKWKTSECKGCQYVKSFNGRYSLNRTHHFYKKMYKAFKDYPKDRLTITGVSPWLVDRIKSSPIYNSFNVQAVLNPVDEFFLEKVDVKKNDKQILFVTPDYYDELKGSKFLVEIARKMKDYRFIVVDAKEQEIDKLDNMKVIYHPSKDKLRELYQSSKCTLLLSKRETFSMVALESLVSNTIVIGFKNGGTNSWAISNTYFYNYGDIDNIVNKVKELLPLVTTKEDYTYLTVGKRYLSLIK